MMVKRLRMMAIAAILLAVSSGTVYGQYSEIDNLKRENARIRLGMQETEKAFQDQYRRLVDRITSLQEAIVQMQETVKQYQRRVVDMDSIRQQVQAENAALRQQLQTEIAALRQQVDAEAKQRQASMQKLAELFNRRGMAAAASAPTTSTTAPTTAAGTAATTATVPANGTSAAAPDGEYFEYVVQKGATLGALAKAYKVTPEDIRKANKLNGDVIFIGQKLLIPKK